MMSSPSYPLRLHEAAPLHLLAHDVEARDELRALGEEGLERGRLHVCV